MKKDKKGFISEFKEFIMRGNVLDMAIGVIMATSFGKITSSLVADVLMPALGFIIGDYDLTDLNFVLSPAVVENGETVKEAVTIGFGNFLTTIIDFVFIALAIFVMIKIFAKVKEISEAKLLKKAKEEEEVAEEAPPAPTTEELLGEILAELKKKNNEE